MPDTEVALPTRSDVIADDRLLSFCQRRTGGVGFLVGGLGALSILFLAIAASIPDGIPLAIVLTLIGAYATSLVGLVRLFRLGHGSTHGTRSVQDRVTRRLERASARYDQRVTHLDAVEGWRPRQGALHPPDRDDRYDRYRVHAEVVSDDRMLLAVVRWYCDSEGRWRIAEDEYEHDHLDDPDAEAFAEAYGRLVAVSSELEHREELGYAEARAERLVQAEDRSALDALARSVNAEPSI